MPAANPRTRPRPASLALVVAGICALALVFTATLGTTASARGVDLTGVINATRRSQLAYEASMVAADRRLQGLKRGQRRTQRTIGKVSARLTQVKKRRAEAREHRDTVLERYRTARASIAPAVPAPAGSAGSMASLRLPTIPPLTLVLPVLVDMDGMDSMDGQAASGRDGAAVAVLPTRTVTPAEFKALRSDLKGQNRKVRHLERRTRTTQRTLRSKTRRVAQMRRQRRAALAQRASSEAALKGRIHAMSGLALRRAVRKTKVRPGRTTPFVWPARGRISQRYGCTGSVFSPARGSCAHFHDGIDIVGASGSPVRAAAVGVISYVGRNPWDRGKRAFMVVIAHPGGYESLYAHVLPIRRVQVGEVVHKAQLIALMGSTGHSTGTHLHFELRRGSTTLDPLARL